MPSTKEEIRLGEYLNEISVRLVAAAIRFPEAYTQVVEQRSHLMPSKSVSLAASGLSKCLDKKTGKVDPAKLKAWVSAGVNERQASGLTDKLMDSAQSAEMLAHKSDPTQIDEWCEVLEEGSKRFALADTLESLSSTLRNKGSSSLEEIRARAMASIKSHEAGTGAHDLSDLLGEALEDVAEWEENKYTDRIFTGIPALDDLLTFPRGNMNVFGALSGGGKTVFGVQVLLHNAVRIAEKGLNAKVIFFSAEMTAKEIAHRMAAHAAGISERGLRAENDTELFDRYRKALEGISRLPIIIDDTVGPELGYVNAKVAQVAAQFDVPLVVFDHTEKAFYKGEPAEDQQTLATVISGMKNVAKANDCHLILLHQLSRAIMSRDDKWPRTSDLRGSGRMEHEAYGIMLLHSEFAINNHLNIPLPEELLTGGYDCTVDIAKQRNGPTGNVRVAFKPNKLRFDDISADSKRPTTKDRRREEAFEGAYDTIDDELPE